MKEILNVIELIGGNVQQVRSYIVDEENRQEKIEEAENDYKSIIKENSSKPMSDAELEERVDDGWFNEDNYDIILVWSDNTVS